MKTFLMSVLVLLATCFSVGCSSDGGKDRDSHDKMCRHNRAVQVAPPAPMVAEPCRQQLSQPQDVTADTSSSVFRLVTKYKKMKVAADPQELTYVEFLDGRTYIGPKEPDVDLRPGYVWGRAEVAARNPVAPDDENRAIWVKVWNPVPLGPRR